MGVFGDIKRIVDSNTGTDVGKRTVELESISLEQRSFGKYQSPYPEYFILMPVKNMRHERAMRPEPLPGHRTA